MKSKYSLLLYIFLFILVVAGLGLLFLRQSAIESLRSSTGADAIEYVVRKSPPANELIDTEILANERLTALKSNVKVFTFEETCGESINAPKRCTRGNNSPFFKKAAK